MTGTIFTHFQCFCRPEESQYDGYVDLSFTYLFVFLWFQYIY